MPWMNCASASSGSSASTAATSASASALRPSSAAALRRALCADGSFALAAFTLGRAYDALGDGAAARRSYQLALRTLDPQDRRHDLILRQVDIGDIALAIQARLSGGDRPPGALGLRGDPGRPAGILPLSSWHGGKRGTG